MLIDVKEAAAYLGWSEWSTYQRAKTGKIPCVKLDRRVFFTKEGLDAHIAAIERKSLVPNLPGLRKIM